MKIYIVRHADREIGDYYNQNLRHQDAPISLKGMEKSKKLLGYFQDKQIKKVIISEYLRTEQTVQYLAENMGLHVTKDKRLNEIYNGIIELMSNEELKEKYPEFWEAFLATQRILDFQTVKQVKR